MADPVHVRIAKEGRRAVAIWMERHWRSAGNYRPHLDLSGANLQGVYLAEADLRWAQLNGASLANADFSQANLREAIFDHADLSAANLTGAQLADASFHRSLLHSAKLNGANLKNCNFSEAILNNVDLRDASLIGANLSSAIIRRGNFSGCNFSQSQLSDTILADVDLSSARGLDEARHVFSSSVGIDTLFRSSGTLPEGFLAGCGLPRSHAALLPSLIGSLEPLQFYTCFISYSHKDEEFTKRLFSRLRDEGLRIWYAPEDIKGGYKLHEQVEQAIRLHDKLLLVLSDESISSTWVQREIRWARKRESQENRRVLFPIRLIPYETLLNWQLNDTTSGGDLAEEIREYFIPDFSNWKDHDSFEWGVERLLRDLRQAST